MCKTSFVLIAFDTLLSLLFLGDILKNASFLNSSFRNDKNQKENHSRIKKLFRKFTGRIKDNLFVLLRRPIRRHGIVVIHFDCYTGNHSSIPTHSDSFGKWMNPRPGQPIMRAFYVKEIE